MSQILATPEMARQLAEASGPIMIVNDEGTMIGYCKPMTTQYPAYTPEELESRRAELDRRRQEARKHPEKGKTLTEVMAYLQGLTGEKP